MIANHQPQLVADMASKVEREPRLAAEFGLEAKGMADLLLGGSSSGGGSSGLRLDQLGDTPRFIRMWVGEGGCGGGRPREGGEGGAEGAGWPAHACSACTPRRCPAR